MKPINFLHTLSTTEQHRLRRWARFTQLIGISVCVGIITLQSIQLYELYNTYAEYNNMHIHTLQTHMHTHADLHQEEQTNRKIDR